jgi:hypothetical protein
VIDEECNEDFTECEWIHACQGHIDAWYQRGGVYKPEPTAK